MTKLRLSLRGIGITIVLGTIISIITNNLEWIISYNLYLDGKVDYEMIERNYDITTNTMFFLLYLVISLVILLYFIRNMLNNSLLKQSRIGTISISTSILILIANVIVYCLFDKDPYAPLLTQNLIISQAVLAFCYTISLLVPLVYVWKISFDLHDTRILKIISISIIILGLFTISYALLPTYYLFIVFMPSRGALLSYAFFITTISDLSAAINVLAGASLILLKKS